jgi:fluoride ion exporter CrcB/FEX
MFVGAFLYWFNNGIGQQEPEYKSVYNAIVKGGFCVCFTTSLPFAGSGGAVAKRSLFIAILYMFLSIILCISAVVGAQMLIK